MTMRPIAGALLAISGSLEFSILLKATVFLAVTLVALRLVPRARASLRHVILAAMFGVLMMLPLAAIFAPPIAVTVPMTSVAPSTFHPNMADPEPAVKRIIGEREYSRTRPTASRPISWSAIVRGGWLVGAVFFLVPVAISLIQSRRVRRNGLPWTDGEPLVRALATAAGFERRVWILLHKETPVPMTFGFAHPTIVLPPDAAEWSPDDIRHALVHELEHVCRADWPTHLMARVVCAMYWFHPLIWVGWRHLCLESERACDDAVLRSGDRTAYADQLVRLARRLLNSGAKPALSIVSRGDLARRIVAVLSATQSRGHVGTPGMVAITLTALALLIAISPLRVSARFSDATPSASIRSAPLVGLSVPAFQISTQLPVRSPLAVNSSAKSSTRFVPASRLPASSQNDDVVASSFVIASVKPGAGVFGIHRGPLISGADFTWENAQLRWLIEWAYGVNAYQIRGEPTWVGGAPTNGVEYFNIAATANAPASADGMRPLLRKLLADRFNLVVHTESHDEPVYALVVVDQNGTLGPNIRAATADCRMLREAAEREGRRPGPNNFPCGNHAGIGQGSARGMSLAALAGIVSRDAGRTVIDKTGLDGIYDWDLTWTPEALRHHPPDRFPSVDPEGPSLFTAVQEQLGIKLEPQDRLGAVLVIDHVERPTPD